MMAKTLQVHDHAVHFYHLHGLEWVDVVSALKADPKKTSDRLRAKGQAHLSQSMGMDEPRPRRGRAQARR